jgi:hypothetical protein
MHAARDRCSLSFREQELTILVACVQEAREPSADGGEWKKQVDDLLYKLNTAREAARRRGEASAMEAELNKEEA